MVRVAPLLALFPLLAGCCCCGGGTPETPQEAALRREREQQEVEALRAGLLATAASPPSTTGLVERACPDTEIEQKSWSARKLLTVDRDYLVRWTDPEFETAEDADADWAWLRSEALQQVSKGADKLDPSDLHGDRERTYLAVFHSTDKARPRIDGSGAYTPGHFDGWLIVVDLLTTEAICQVQFSAGSSPRITEQATGEGTIRERQEAVDEDFQEVFGDQATAALERISSHLEVSLDWTN